MIGDKNAAFIIPVTNEYFADNLRANLTQNFPQAEVVFIENANSFFDAWREGLSRSRAETVVFTHQDVEIYSIPNLDKYFSGGFGLLGAAGSKVVTFKKPWWYMNKSGKRKNMSGVVWHRNPGDPIERVVFGRRGEVVVLDGVVLITKRSIIKKVGIPKFSWCKWDYYDHVISLEYIKKGFRLATIPIKIVHYSGGGGTKDIGKAEEEFKKEYFKDKSVWSI